MPRDRHDAGRFASLRYPITIDSSLETEMIVMLEQHINPQIFSTSSPSLLTSNPPFQSNLATTHCASVYIPIYKWNSSRSSPIPPPSPKMLTSPSNVTTPQAAAASSPKRLISQAIAYVLKVHIFFIVAYPFNPYQCHTHPSCSPVLTNLQQLVALSPSSAFVSSSSSIDRLPVPMNKSRLICDQFL